MPGRLHQETGLLFHLLAALFGFEDETLVPVEIDAAYTCRAVAVATRDRALKDVEVP